MSTVSLIALLATAGPAGAVGSSMGVSRAPPLGLFSPLCVGTALIVGWTS